ncbi:hypothetical protein GCM10015535_35420 [Streptomyces gelaticus]|uniref:Uncharacterized protein n=1 Tax=Streptomyces gelaticus TaxID=285446 RepID=A0ABQ2W2R9_9ACTN|nr:hypothetical protein [Streptomyces gelaticus]GGV86722.1 hypothetical protein GCM10015535_35420 [Streptomyces gelaticus]
MRHDGQFSPITDVLRTIAPLVRIWKRRLPSRESVWSGGGWVLKAVDLTGPGSGTAPGVMEELAQQVLDGSDAVVDSLVEQIEDGKNDAVAALPRKSEPKGDRVIPMAHRTKRPASLWSLRADPAA